MKILNAFFCVMLFSLTAPFTRIAALQTHAETIILLRIIGAALVCLIAALVDKWVPPKKIWISLIYTSLGSVIGFNAFMAFGLREVPSSHAAVLLALLPIMTVIYSVFRDRRNPGFKFWLFALLGSTLAFGFFYTMNVKHLLLGDLLVLLSVVSSAFGYVEGGRLSREYGGRKIMTWAVLIATPLAIILSIIYFSTHLTTLNNLDLKGWFSLSYVAFVSQSLGMFLWFSVLSIGPMEQIALVQLLQPFFTLFAAIFLLHETVMPISWVFAFLVAICVMGSNKSKV